MRRNLSEGNRPLEGYGAQWILRWQVLIPRGPMVTASGYDVSYFCNQKIPGSSPGGEELFFGFIFFRFFPKEGVLE